MKSHEINNAFRELCSLTYELTGAPCSLPYIFVAGVVVEIDEIIANLDLLRDALDHARHLRIQELNTVATTREPG